MLRVLVADDNHLSLCFFDEALRSLGWQPVAVADGTTALRAAQLSIFDLVLLDARMPDLGGAETWQRIRSSPGPSRHACPLATTADDTAGARSELLAAGFVDVLVKPLSLGALRSALAKHAAAFARSMATEEPSLLDDRQAMAAGGDVNVMNALRHLLVGELDALPAEMAILSGRRDAHALRERLHRLDASAGFCGAPALSRAAHVLRCALDGADWPDGSLVSFLATCARVRTALVVGGSGLTPEGRT